jgi:hypothetical protein
MAERGAAAPEIVARLRAICAALPETEEEPAWIGTRWRVRNKTIAHVVAIEADWPKVYGRAFNATGPMTVVTFESSGEELTALSNLGPPFHRPSWRRTVVGLSIDDDTDWTEVAELITESYRVLAPKSLAARLGPGDGRS